MLLPLLALIALLLLARSFGSSRAKVVAVAMSQLGQGAGGGLKYWNEVLPSGPPFPKEWCGAFLLWVLHQAGLMRDVNWEIGTGFLPSLPVTENPKPGDIAFFDHLQHQALIANISGEKMRLVNGNGFGGVVTLSTNDLSSATRFYSIAPLIGERV